MIVFVGRWWLYLKDGDVGNPPSERDRQTEGETVFAKIFSNASRLALKICQLLSSLLALLLQNNQYFHGKSIYNFLPHIWWVGQKYQIKPEIVDTTNTKNVKANYTYNNTKEGTRTNIEARRWWVGQKDQKYKVEISDQPRNINVYK